MLFQSLYQKKYFTVRRSVKFFIFYDRTRIRIPNPYYSIFVNRTRNFFSSSIFTNRIETRKTKRSFLCTLFGDETNFLERPLIDQPSCLQIVTWLYSKGISSSRVVSAMYAKEFYEANVFDCDLYWSNESIQM